MTTLLVVLKPFLKYSKGDTITDSHTISTILDSEHRKFVVKVGTPAKTAA